LRLSPNGGPPTTVTEVQGIGFGPSEIVDITFDGTPVGSTTTTAEGAFSLQVNVPASALPGPHTVEAVGETSGASADANFSVSTPWGQRGFDAGASNWNPFENVLTPSTVPGLTSRWTETGVLAAVARGLVFVSLADG